MKEAAVNVAPTRSQSLTMAQGAINFRIGSKVRVDLDNVNDRIPSSLASILKDDPRGTLVDYKMTDGMGIGFVLELSNGSKNWFFENEIAR